MREQVPESSPRFCSGLVLARSDIVITRKDTIEYAGIGWLISN